MSISIQKRLEQQSIVLPNSPSPAANYLPFVIAGNLLFLSGQGPQRSDGTWAIGKVGEDASLEEAYEHARLAGARLLAVAQLALGSLERVSRVVKLLGLVNAVPNFRDHSKVIDGCSDLMIAVFGEAGRHARSAMGAGSLPRNMTVEIEAIFEIRLD